MIGDDIGVIEGFLAIEVVLGAEVPGRATGETEGLLTDVAATAALRRSRIVAELEADRIASESALRRSRIEAEIEADRYATVSALRRSRLEDEIAT
ncbi:unnamed protein product [Sphagnum balticum]